MATKSFKGKNITVRTSLFKSNDRRLTIKRITEANVAAANLLFMAAIDVFVSTAVNSMVVDTGMSVAGFEALATFLGASPQKVQGLKQVKLNGMKDVKDAIGRNKGIPRSSYTNISGKSVNSPRDAARGRALGKKAFTIQYANATTGITSFKFDAVIWQYAHRLEIGKETLAPASIAMEKFLQDNVRVYMDPLRILRTGLNIQVT